MAELPWLHLCSAKEVVASCRCAFWHFAPTLQIRIGEKLVAFLAFFMYLHNFFIYIYMRLTAVTKLTITVGNTERLVYCRNMEFDVQRVNRCFTITFFICVVTSSAHLTEHTTEFIE